MTHERVQRPFCCCDWKTHGRQKRGQDVIARSFFLFLFLSITALPQSASLATEARTWRYVAELSASDRMKLDLHPSSPRDPQIPYLPAEQFPFAPPYTAEEMGAASDGVSPLSIME